MSFIEDMSEAVARLAVFAELEVDAVDLPSSAMGLSDASVRDLLAETAGLIRQASLLQSVLAGVASTRSRREHGHGGPVQESGHRNAVEFIRDLTGTTRSEATRAVRVGEALLDGVSGSSAAPVTPAMDAAPAVSPWHEPLRLALLAGAITTAQHHAIMGGLGEPPTMDGRESHAVIEAWRAAARELAREAAVCSVEDLGARARALKDLLDPTGAEERYALRFARRSYRWSTTSDGQRLAHIVFDDEMGEWVRAIMDAALAPRRGGPRFVTDDEKKAAAALVGDPRSNDQLAYDLFVDLLRAGALADAHDVFGTKEPGVRLVTMKDTVTGSTAHRDAFGRLIASACTHDGLVVVPGSVLERAMCMTGTIDVLTDTAGNPLDAGREMRLYNSKQRLTLAIRDGGCLWPGCDRPPEFCEAHHCDHWVDGGRTDCDRGVLLCRFHHLHLHNAGWRISRDARGPFVLHAPAHVGGEPIVLRSKSPLRWLWDPPPERAGWRAAA